jgi:hypothetical protein
MVRRVSWAIHFLLGASIMSETMRARLVLVGVDCAMSNIDNLIDLAERETAIEKVIDDVRAIRPHVRREATTAPRNPRHRSCARR